MIEVSSAFQMSERKLVELSESNIRDFSFPVDIYRVPHSTWEHWELAGISLILVDKLSKLITGKAAM